MLQSGDWKTRTLALRRIDAEGLDLGRLGDYELSMTSPHIAERYWVARALAAGSTSRTLRDLKRMLDDQHPNVRCMAFNGLARRGAGDSTGMIIRKIQKSGHWYVQWYAYRALRSLGWVQPK
jgi:HEAT repeat protein